MFFLGWTEPRDALLQTTLTPLMPSTAPNQATAFSIFPVSTSLSRTVKLKKQFYRRYQGRGGCCRSPGCHSQPSNSTLNMDGLYLWQQEASTLSECPGPLFLVQSSAARAQVFPRGVYSSFTCAEGWDLVICGCRRGSCQIQDRLGGK